MLGVLEINHWHWVGFIACVLFFLALDLGVFHKSAHVVKFKEAIGWFQEKGLTYSLLDPDAYFDYFKVPLMGVGIRGVPRAAGARVLGRAA